MDNNIREHRKKQREKRAAARKESDKDTEEMKHIVSDFFGVWSNLEVSLAQLLGTILNIQPDYSEIPKAIYYTIKSFDGRMQIVNSALKHLIDENPKYLSTLKEPASEIFEKVVQVKNRRNYIAHGSIHRIYKNEKMHVRFTAPVTDVFNFGGPLKKNQLPGLSISCIKSIIKQCEWVTAMLDDIEDIIFSYNENDGTCLDTIEQLIARLQEISYPH